MGSSSSFNGVFSSGSSSLSGVARLGSSSSSIGVSTSASGLRVICISQDGHIERSWLPNIATGRYHFQGLTDRVYVEAREGCWYACSKNPSSFVSSRGDHVHQIKLTERSLIPVVDDGKRFMFYTEAAEHEGEVYHNYLQLAYTTVSIGRASNCDIVCNNRFVSQYHAKLSFGEGGWEIEDNNSTNHLYVNGQRVTESQLKLGDVVFAMGLTIVIGQGYLAINDGRSDVSVNTTRLRRLKSTSELSRVATPIHAVSSVYNREPRHRFALLPKAIEIESPPMSLNSDRIPLVLRMGGVAAMGGMSAMSGNYMPLISSLLFPVLSQKYTDKQKKEYEERRQAKYEEYLQKKSAEIRAEAYRERNVLSRNYPDLNIVSRYPYGGNHLWERRNVDDDFLHVRLGTGRVPLRAELLYPKRRFELEEDELEERMFRLAETPVFLEQAPIVVSLVESYVCGIRGDTRAALMMVQALLLQIAVLQSYDECKIILLADHPLVDGVLSYVKTLPHAWDNQQSIRFVATNASEAYEIGSYLREQLGDDLRRPRPLNEIVKERPYYCVFALDRQIFDGMEVLKEIMQVGTNCGVSVITAFPDPPKDCMLLLYLGANRQGKAAYLREIEREDDAFTPDVLEQSQFDNSMYKVSNITIRHVNEANELPKSLTFLDMLGIGNLDQLAPLRRWQENDPTKSLAVPIGVNPEGTPAMLDLHERVHGPHGLVAGMTGSGKSEFLLTYILSMAINFHPDEVAFVLIDYKGGGLAGAFVDEGKGIHLPHVVATVTNLDGAAIQRSLISLEAEVKRRQQVFNKAKSAVNEGTMDIYAYQRLYRRGLVSNPVPHLIIISDEFAELKQQQPEFMDQLVSIARIGRSLGVHLILATQKPAGVVNEQIWSNSKFKACLKVQSKQDSLDMLKRPEAAEITQVGRYYLQIGYNESFSMGQSGWSGASYEPTDEVEVHEDQTVQFVDMVGQVVYEGRPQPSKKPTDKSQLVAVVEELCRVAREANVKPRMLWKEPLPSQIDFNAIVRLNAREPERKPVFVPLGMLDDPANQRQLIFTISPQTTHNILVTGEPDSGKTTFVQSLLLGLARLYGPNRINFYVLDYSGGAHAPLANLPHCGAVLNEDDGASLGNLFDLLKSIVTERKELFRELGVSSFEAALQLRVIPIVLVVIDGFATFSAGKIGEALSYRLPDIIKSGMNYGIRYCVTCGHTSEASSLLRRELGMRVSLVQQDKFGHADTLGVRCDYVPPSLPGRGLVMYGGVPMELQLARFAPTVPESSRLQVLSNEVSRLVQLYIGQPAAKRMPTIPKDETFEHFAQQFEGGRIPLGYDVSSAKPVALPLRQLSSLSLYMGNQKGKLPLIENILQVVQRENMQLFVVAATTSLFTEDGALATVRQQMEVIPCTLDDVYVFFRNRLLGLVVEQRNQLKTFCLEHGMEPSKTAITTEAFRYLRSSTKPLMVLFEDFGDVVRLLGVEGEDSKPQATEQIASAIFEAAFNLNTFFVGCFRPGEESKLYSSKLYRSYAKGSTSLLFGGKLDEQKLVDVPWKQHDFNKEGVFNLGIVAYRDEFHTLMMPCRELEEATQDVDERSIFA